MRVNWNTASFWAVSEDDVSPLSLQQIVDYARGSESVGRDPSELEIYTTREEADQAYAAKTVITNLSERLSESPFYARLLADNYDKVKSFLLAEERRSRESNGPNVTIIDESQTVSA